MARQMPNGEPASAIRLDDAAREAAAGDFGGCVSELPAAVLIAGSREEVIGGIKAAASRGWTVAPRGRGHSVFGRSQASGGLVIDVSGLDRVGAVDGDRVRVEAGASWRKVLAVALEAGKMPPALADYLDLSVGGVLTVGGVGAGTLANGVVSDHVVELEVVTGAGEALACSAERLPALFDAVRGGLGKVGIITAATLKLAPAPLRARRFLLFYRDAATLLDQARGLLEEGRFDAVLGAIAWPPGSADPVFRLEAVRYFDDEDPDDEELLSGLGDDRPRREAMSLSFWEFADRLALLEADLRAEGRWEFPHPWLTTFVGDSAIESVIEEELRVLDPPRDLGPRGMVVLTPMRPAAVRTPLLRLPTDELCWTFNLIRLPASSERGEAGRLIEANEAAYARIKEAGGTLYPVSAFELSPEGWREHFGPAFPDLAAARGRFDPDGIMTPGYGVL